MNYTIGLDIGTSSVKGVLYSEKGEIAATGKGSFRYSHPVKGAVEIPAETYLETCLSTIKSIASKCPADGKITAICQASASGNLLLLDGENKPLTPIYNWQDCRTENEANEVLKEIDHEAFYRKAGWEFDYHTFPVAMLSYLKVHNPSLLSSCAMAVMSTEYLNFILTGKWGITTSAGTPSYMIDQEKGEYIPEIIELFGLTESKLPPIIKVGTVLGNILPEMEEKTGLSSDVKVIPGTFDHPSAARGIGVLEEGQLLLSCGTSWVGFYPIKDREKALKNRMIIDPFMSVVGGCWAGMTSIASISNAIDDYIVKYVCSGPDRYAVFAAMAKMSESGCHGLTLNLTSDSEELIDRYPRPDVARAIMEAVIRLLARDINAIRESGIDVKSVKMVGGPSENSLWKDIIEEFTSLEITLGQGSYAGAVGAAKLAFGNF